MESATCWTGTTHAGKATGIVKSRAIAIEEAAAAGTPMILAIVTRATSSRRTSTCRAAASVGRSASATASTRSTAPRAARWRPSARSASCPKAISTTSETTRRARDEALKHLENEGLIRTSPLSSDDRAVTLTDRGRDLLEANRYERDDRSHEPRQAFYAGVRKPRELTHDTKVYRAYQRAEERLRGQGGRVRRVVLDYELKRDYQRFLHERNRGKKDCDGRPDREPEEIARWAREHELPYDDGHVRFPDARIEYEDRDGRSRHEDIEVVTAHYRGAHAGSCRQVRIHLLCRGRRDGRRTRRRRPADRTSADHGGVDPMTLPPAPDRWTIELANTERMEAIAAFGFTERQARFLLNVLLHSGVFIERQYLQLLPASSTARRAPTSSRRSSSGDSRRRSPPASSIAGECSTSTTSRSGRPSASQTTGSASRPLRDG